jgi:outer membrane lipoprotein carrier protein
MYVGMLQVARIAALLAAAATAGQSPSVSDVVDRVQKRFDATSDFTATVQQELVVTSAGRTLDAHGTVAFKRPGKMRWILQNDEPQVIVADGETLWFYQPEEHQVLRSPFETAFRSSTPISFLTGVGRIRDDFDVVIDESEEGKVHLALLPRRQGGEVGRLRLTAETGNYDIVAAEVVDPLGNITRLRFSDLKRNVGLDDSLFEFEVPEGVDVIDAPRGY